MCVCFTIIVVVFEIRFGQSPIFFHSRTRPNWTQTEKAWVTLSVSLSGSFSVFLYACRLWEERAHSGILNVLESYWPCLELYSQSERVRLDIRERERDKWKGEQVDGNMFSHFCGFGQAAKTRERERERNGDTEQQSWAESSLKSSFAVQREKERCRKTNREIEDIHTFRMMATGRVGVYNIAERERESDTENFVEESV